eukprot:366414-Chlamydomonas_euryale.AAC.6
MEGLECVWKHGHAAAKQAAFLDGIRRVSLKVASFQPCNPALQDLFMALSIHCHANLILHLAPTMHTGCGCPHMHPICPQAKDDAKGSGSTGPKEASVYPPPSLRTAGAHMTSKEIEVTEQLAMQACEWGGRAVHTKGLQALYLEGFFTRLLRVWRPLRLWDGALHPKAWCPLCQASLKP